MNIEQLTGLHATTIQGVIASLDRIVEWSKQHNKRTGYFAALYRKVTIKVEQGIENNAFDDSDRMEKLDVIFANRYLDAFEAYYKGQPVTKVWKLAFTVTDKWSPVVFQHLMIGMNAHINLDLAIAAAETVEPESLPTLKPDFEKINTLLASLVEEVQVELAQIWPAFKWIDRFARNADETFADKSMIFARDRAWSFANEYATSIDKARTLEKMDSRIYLLGRVLVSLPIQFRLLLLAIRMMERGSVAEKIAILE